MNVDVFVNSPPLKWYFVSAVPFMVVLLLVAIMLRNISFSKTKARIWRMSRSDGGKEVDEVLQESDLDQGKV